MAVTLPASIVQQPVQAPNAPAAVAAKPAPAKGRKAPAQVLYPNLLPQSTQGAA